MMWKRTKSCQAGLGAAYWLNDIDSWPLKAFIIWWMISNELNETIKHLKKNMLTERNERGQQSRSRNKANKTEIPKKRIAATTKGKLH